MFHEMPLKLNFMKCSERKVSQCKKQDFSTSVSKTSENLHLFVLIHDYFMTGFVCSLYSLTIFV